jgi:hypothetical protein
MPYGLVEQMVEHTFSAHSTEAEMSIDAPYGMITPARQLGQVITGFKKNIVPPEHLNSNFLGLEVN